MDTTTINAELQRQISYLADDADYMQKALNAIKRLVMQRAEEVGQLTTKDEILSNFKQACKELKLYEEGKLVTRPIECLLDEL